MVSLMSTKTTYPATFALASMMLVPLRSKGNIHNILDQKLGNSPDNLLDVDIMYSFKFIEARSK